MPVVPWSIASSTRRPYLDGETAGGIAVAIIAWCFRDWVRLNALAECLGKGI